jgi:hypothetical protein
MSGMHDTEVKGRRRQERKIWRTGLLVSLLLHMVVFLGWRGVVIPPSPFAAAGPRAGDNRAAKGSLQAINIRTSTPVPIVPPPIPIPAEIEVEPIEIEVFPAEEAASVLGEQPGLDEVVGLPDGVGAGDGGDTAEGFYTPQLPTPRGMIIPPANRELRGTEVQVWVFVNDMGRVVADSTRLDPPTRDGDFNKRLVREAAEWIFRPAVREGKPVSSWFPYRIKM